MKDTLNTKETFTIISNLADIYSVRHGEIIPTLGKYIDTPIIEEAVQKKLIEAVQFTYDLLLDNIAVAEGTYDYIYLPLPGDIKKKLLHKRQLNRKKRKQRK